MAIEVTQNWWLVLLRGICALIFGLAAFAWPGMTLYTLVLLYGAYALADGIFAIGAAVTRQRGRGTGWLMAVGVLGIVAGVVAFLWPGITAIVLLTIIASWAIVTGLFEVIAAIWFRRILAHDWLLALAGVISILFGILLFARPVAGLLTVVWIIGAYALLLGVSLIGLSLQLWRYVRTHPEEPHGVYPA